MEQLHVVYNVLSVGLTLTMSQPEITCAVVNSGGGVKSESVM
jgi:hypothetical protein